MQCKSFSTIERGEIRNLANLKKLSLFGTNAEMSTNITEESIFGIVKSDLPSLKELHMLGQQFKLRPESLKPLKGTSLIELSFNINADICDLPDGAFAGLDLQSLDISVNDCTAFNGKAFSDLILQKLDLSNNRLRLFPDFSSYEETSSFRKSLTHLDLSNNKIEESFLKNVFLGFDSLLHLNLKNNRLTFVDTRVFLVLLSLQELDLSDNCVHTFNYPLRSQTLRVLYLQGNPLDFYDYAGTLCFRYAKIEKISLSKCNFGTDYHTISYLFQNIASLKTLLIQQTTLPVESLGNAFWGMDNLEQLQLKSIGLQSIREENFIGLKSLKELDLSGNRITLIKKSSFPPRILRNLSTLDLSLNPFDCTCKLFWFLEWIKDNTTQINCHDFIIMKDCTPVLLQKVNMVFLLKTCGSRLKNASDDR